ncbi:MAG: magnesium/cobalt transporter CorA [Fusobacteriota bacterium]
MPSILSKKFKKRIAVPGTPIYTGNRKEKSTQMMLISYDEDNCKQEILKEIGDLDNYPKDKTTWISVLGLSDTEKIIGIGRKLGIHDMITEDILDVYQDQKIDFLGEFDFIVLKIPRLEDDKMEEVSILKKGNLVLTFFDKKVELFNNLEKRIIENEGRIRKMDANYLVYSIFDMLTDRYFQQLEVSSDDIEVVESKIFENPENDILKEIYNLREDNHTLRQSNRKIIGILNKYERQYPEIIREKYGIYYKDLFDHTNMIKENLENMRENITGLIELNMSLVSHKMNKVMQTLTMISTIFIPLGFLAGLYGMNFEYMPELQFKYAYPTLIIVMLLIVISMLTYFKKNKWF